MLCDIYNTGGHLLFRAQIPDDRQSWTGDMILRDAVMWALDHRNRPNVMRQLIANIGLDVPMHSILQTADLRGASLQGLDLRHMWFNGADLRGADLHGANLRGANFCGAFLDGANLSRSNAENAVFDNATLGTDERGERADLTNMTFNGLTSFMGATVLDARMDDALKMHISDNFIVR